ncbi:hypothetical protein [Psychrobium sp. 1_MG-2023]|uniref:hypothetical protein n=1 Tax=Psychrobium sp. 1_MG-2023 TaxID=3062624 RepID=UPI000C327232|nr:hypothetical protein [Psychrobium sp. 1_MG-2023]MDP2560207.1 hypothetical protein [Psychrobium sp. 1_MG-2023]PKF57018.1 hypothetical protein CW748_07940 [Alteromonadales bacterium alter-6D02]
MSLFIIIGIAVLVILLIVVTVMQQQRKKQDSEKRIEVARLTLVIDETEDLLSRVVNIPVTKGLMIILHNRILETIKSVQQITNDRNLAIQINDRQTLIESIGKTFQSKGLESFRLPNDDREVLQMVQLIKKLKGVVNSEHKRGRINPEVFTNEIKRADLMQIRININSIIKRAKIAMDAKQSGSARTYLDKAIKTLKAINSDGDSFVKEKLDEAMALMQQLDQVKIERDERQREEQEEKSSTDLDALFQPKKKW